jgi:hypothetical protein
MSADLIVPVVYEVEIPDDGDLDTLAEDALYAVGASELLKHANTEEVEIFNFNIEDEVP